MRQFVAVADQLSFRHAAEHLHMVHPPLSIAIGKLEAEFGVLFFECKGLMLPGKTYSIADGQIQQLDNEKIKKSDG